MMSKSRLVSMLPLMFVILVTNGLGFTEEDIQELDLPREDGSYVELEDPGIQELDLPEKDGSYAELEDPYTDPDVVSEDPRRRRSRRCGPDVTSWLIRQMNRNRNNGAIRSCRSWYNTFLWPRCLVQFANLVANCKPWDYKCTQTFRRRSCPYRCPKTVTLCGRCVNYDVPGNIHYGYVGRAASIRRWVLLFAANTVQKGGIDDARDQVAIRIGMDRYDVPSKRANFCRDVLSRIGSLNRDGTSGCQRCTTKY